MIAETALSVIEALPEKEYTRLLQMLGVEPKPKKIKPKIGMSEGELTEYVIRRMSKRRKK